MPRLRDLASYWIRKKNVTSSVVLHRVILHGMILRAPLLLIVFHRREPK